MFIGCTESKPKNTDNEKVEEEVKKGVSFKQLSSEETNILFSNTINDVDSINFFNYEYIYNGGGVAVGDINNDGLTDIYFTGNQVEDKLYLNKGDFKFEDITESAIGNFAGQGWHTGVSMVDINNDGWLDIYVCRSGIPSNKENLRNLLFVNNKDNTFSEEGKLYGVDIKRKTTHSSFFDMDNDGDLDLYVMNHPNQQGGGKKSSVGDIKDLIKRGSPESDVLLENIDGKYVDITKASGISNHAYGLGIAVGDLNNDGYSDIYISNDYMAPDHLYINQKNGTFKDEILTQMKHISNFSMGNDMSDFNNDGFPDILSVDMVSEDHVRSKKNMGGMSTEKFWNVVQVGYHFQYMFNGLQLNNGNGTFSEIAQLAGISKTDWSWAPLFIDFDNDGHKDLFITNGYRRDSRDNDYMLQRNNPKNKDKEYSDLLELIPATKIQNYIYQNSGHLKFEKKMADWNLNNSVNSNGAAYADFDNDGDLDLVLNNMQEVSHILENKQNLDNNYIRIKISGSEKNTGAIGAKITIKTKDGIQYQQQNTVRGYQSSVEPIIHFGIGANTKVDEISITWVDGKNQILKNVEPNQTLELAYDQNFKESAPITKAPTLFEDITSKMQKVLHKEVAVNDFLTEVLLPNKMSQLGPFISSGDVNNDNLEDFYLSGSRKFAGQLYIQKANGTFKLQKGPWEKEREREELGSELFDVDNDGDLDLYVVSGSNEFNYLSELLYDQLYINDGKGGFTNESKTRLPKMITSGQSITLGDIDNDKDLDVFIGGRQTPGYYPYASRSYLLVNNNGVFTDLTSASPELRGPGMITASIFDDFDQDGDQDLICVGEWMPISFFENTNAKFTNVTSRYTDVKEVGWWSSIAKGDFNEDGKNDYIVGNIGLNNKFHPSAQYPLEIFCNDFDKSGTKDIVLAKYQNNICYPVRGKSCSTEQMSFISKKFPNYSDFAEADIEKLYGKENLDSALHYSATNFKSIILLSGSSKKFTSNPLPIYAQFSALNKVIALDINKDGHLDFVGVGNNYAAEVETVRYDAGVGSVLLGDGKGEFKALRSFESGWFTNSDAKDLISIDIQGKKTFIIANNNNILNWISLN